MVLPRTLLDLAIVLRSPHDAPPPEQVAILASRLGYRSVWLPMRADDVDQAGPLDRLAAAAPVPIGVVLTAASAEVAAQWLATVAAPRAHLLVDIDIDIAQSARPDLIAAVGGRSAWQRRVFTRWVDDDAAGCVLRASSRGAVASAVREACRSGSLSRPNPPAIGVALDVSIGRTMSEADARAQRDPSMDAARVRDSGLFGTFEDAQEQVLELAAAGANWILADLAAERDLADLLAQLRAVVSGPTAVLHANRRSANQGKVSQFENQSGGIATSDGFAPSAVGTSTSKSSTSKSSTGKSSTSKSSKQDGEVTMTAIPSVAPRQSAAPAGPTAPFDETADIVVVGGGGGGLPTALFARWLGDEVIVLEKSQELGGTARKAAFWYWVPNNEPMRAMGVADPEEDFLRYVARLSQPSAYDPRSPTLGLVQGDYDLCRAIYESASPAAELLHSKGALVYRHCEGVPDYWSQLPEDKAPTGRVLVPAGARDSMSDGGVVAIASLSAAAERDGVEIRTGVRVQRLITDDGTVIGVEASTPDGRTVRVRARKAVVFASGGFTHDVELRRNFLAAPVYGGCAATTNEGDFVAIATRVGAQLRNMNYAWMCPIPLEKAVARDPKMSGMFSVAGDSMIFVDKRGHRIVNEKLPYNELAQTFFVWDPMTGEYPNLVLIQIWDEHSQRHSASDEYGRLIVAPGTDDAHVITGRTLVELTDRVRDRLARYAAVTGGLALSPDFAANLGDSIERFNILAEKGVDEDFGRGEAPVQLLFNGLVQDDPERSNPTMRPISDSGPYYAALVTGGNLDTKGGPKTTTHAQILDDTDRPIPGLYGVGNCVASPSARAYWAGGATLGPIIAFAYRAAQAAHAEPVRRIPNVNE